MIGETLYIFDSNRRLYEDEYGNKTNTPNLRFCFMPLVIVSETKQSWVASYRTKDVRFAKKDLRVTGAHVSAGAGGQGYTEQGMEDFLYIERHRAQAAHDVQGCKDVDKLRRIRAILGEV